VSCIVAYDISIGFYSIKVELLHLKILAPLFCAKVKTLTLSQHKSTTGNPAMFNRYSTACTEYTRLSSFLFYLFQHNLTLINSFLTQPLPILVVLHIPLIFRAKRQRSKDAK